MVVSLASGGPAEAAGMLPGDIVLDIDGAPAGRPRALTRPWVRTGSARPSRCGCSAPARSRDQRHDRGPSSRMSDAAFASGSTHRPGSPAGLTSMLEAAGHVLTDDTPDVELCDMDRASSPRPKEAEAPVVALTTGSPPAQPAGVLAPDATAEQLDAALRAVFVGLLVRSPEPRKPRASPPPRTCRC